MQNASNHTKSSSHDHLMRDKFIMQCQQSSWSNIPQIILHFRACLETKFGVHTQALLDVYTIKRELGRLENVRIGLVGDLANGRTARSLAYLMSMYPGVKVYFVAPEVVRMKEDIKEFLTSRGVEWEEADDLRQVPFCTCCLEMRPCQCTVSNSDKNCVACCVCVILIAGIVGCLRGGCAVPDAHSEGAIPGGALLPFCAERSLKDWWVKHSCRDMTSMILVQDRPEEYERARGKYIIDSELMKILPKHSVVMHPLPRVDEVCGPAQVAQLWILLSAHISARSLSVSSRSDAHHLESIAPLNHGIILIDVSFPLTDCVHAWVVLGG